MKILFVNRAYFPDGTAGPAFSVQSLAEQLVEEGHGAVVVCRKHTPELICETVNGVTVYRLPLSFMAPEVVLRFHKILEIEQPDVVHCNFLGRFSGPDLAGAARLYNIPILHTIREHALLCEKRTMFTNGRRCTVRCDSCKSAQAEGLEYASRLDAVIGISEYILQRHLEYGFFTDTPIRKVINNSYHLPGVQENRPPSDRSVLRLGFMGQLERFKGIDFLLSQMNTDLAQLPVSLLIAGRLSKQQGHLIQRYATRNIRFGGFMDPKRFFPLIDLLIMPSLLDEPFGRVAMESLMHGVPVIASNRGGLPEIITHGENGWLFDPDNPGEFSDLIQAICRKREMLQELTIDPVRLAQRYSPKHILQQYKEIYRQIINNNSLPAGPSVDADALHISGIRCSQNGDHREGSNLIRQAIAADPRNPHYYYNLGIVLQSYGDATGAMQAYRQAVACEPRYARAYNNLGNILKRRGRLQEAADCFQQAIQSKPDYPDAWYNLGLLQQFQGAFDQAVSSYLHTLRIKPDYLSALNNLGYTYKEQGLLSQACDCFQKAVAMAPDFHEAFNNLGNCLLLLQRYDEAINCYRKALAINPGSAGALRNLFYLCLQTCNWQDISALSRQLDNSSQQALQANQLPGEEPFVNVLRCDDPAFNLQIARAWSAWISQAIPRGAAFSHADHCQSSRKITIGYLSGDFRDHPVGHIMQSLFALHDRTQFTINCYSTGPDDHSLFRKRIIEDCDNFIDLEKKSSLEAAQRIHADGTDILVDLMGSAQNNNLTVCALRPAPILITWLGYPGSTGSDFIDYIIGDSVVIPDGHEKFFSEKPILLPDCYQITDWKQPISKKPVCRMDFGLPESAVVFGAFTHATRLDPEMFSCWMEILQQVPKSVLWLRAENDATRENILSESQKAKVHPDRLIFANRLAKDQHLARHTLADICLDTMVYNDHTTISDALWAGVPVITRIGVHFASRVSASLLNAIGLPELITTSLDEYKDLAIRLARNPDQRQSLKRKLNLNRQTEPLFDTLRFTKNLEKAYQKVWEIYTAGEKPQGMRL